MSKADVIYALKRHRSFIVTSHIHMEGDSLGSQLAVACLLRQLKKDFILLHKDIVPERYQFLLNNFSFKTELPKRWDVDTVIVTDCPVLHRIALPNKGVLRKARCVINIDHHISNTYFGDVNWVEPNMSSCGEMLFYVFKELRLKIDILSAEAMYVAILTDTGAFGYENTHPQTHSVVAELLKRGVNPLLVRQRIDESRSFEELMLLQSTLSTLRLYYDGKVATMQTTVQMLKRLGLSPDKTENFINYARSISSVEVAIYFLEDIEKRGRIRISFRSKGNVDVNVLASEFNGGGHPNASGCVVEGSLADVKRYVLSKTQKFIEDISQKKG